MKKLSRRQHKNKLKIHNSHILSLQESISLLKETATAKFVETFELHVNLNLKNFNQRLSETIILPHNIEKKKKIAVITINKQLDQAKKAGADIIGNEDIINKLISKPIKFDVLISIPEMITKLVKFGRLLGPKGLMPSFKSGTLIKSSELVSTIKQFKKGKFEYKVDKTGNIHIGFGKSNFSEMQLLDNLKFLYNSIKKNKPIGIKGNYFKSIHLCTTMGPSIKLNLNELN